MRCRRTISPTQASAENSSEKIVIVPDILRKASHVGIVGGSGTGKTEYGVRYLMMSRHDRVFIFDHQGEYPSRLGKLAVPCTTLSAVVNACEDYRIVLYDPADEFGGEFENALAVWSDLVFELAKASEESGVETLAYCDELQKIVSVNNTPRELKNLLQTGRKFKLDTCFVSQQPNRMPNEVREQWTELVTFRLKDPASLEALDNFGLSDEEISDIANLPDLHYIWRHLQRGESVTGVLQFSR